MSIHMRKNQVWKTGALCWMLAMMALAGSLSAQENASSMTVSVIGAGPIRDQNVAQAREQAIADGLASAVNQVALSLVSSDAVTRDFQRFTAALESRADAFVSTYKVLSENPTGETYRVMLQVTVSVDPLKERLAGIRTVESDPAAPRPKVLFLIAEQDLQDISPRFWWGEAEAPASSYVEEAMDEQMRAAGFEVIEHGHDVPDVAVEAAIIFQPDLDNREAVDIGKSFSADIVIVGKAIIYKVIETLNDDMPAFNATVTARALRVDTGEEIGSVLETVVRKHSEESGGGMATLMAAGAQAGEALAARIAPMRRQVGAPSDFIEVTVTGTRNLGNFIRFRKALAEIDGVREIRMGETQPDQTVVEVDFQGPAPVLAEALKSLSFQLFAAEIRNVSDQRVSVALMPRAASPEE